jgi:anti-sigma factor RsiW
VNPDQHIPYETLARFLDHIIDADEKASVERHLKDCPYCRQDVADALAWRAEQQAKIKAAGWRRFFPWL